ncbi:MAG: hypothetical protein SPL51_08145 [Lachnospiraceae bacterium]|nr:hypothetical protein [Lachnospiraceae bacterium]
MYTISDEAQKNIKSIVGLGIQDIKNMSFDEQEMWIAKRVKNRVIFSTKRKKGIIGRGNALLARRKIRTFEDLDKKSRKYIGI